MLRFHIFEGEIESEVEEYHEGYLTDDDVYRILYGKSAALVKHPVSGELVSARNRSGSAKCSQAASQWRTGNTTPDTFKQLAACRAMAGAHKQASSQRAAGNEAKAQVLEHRATSGKAGVGNRKNLAAQLKATRAKKQAIGTPGVIEHPAHPEIQSAPVDHGPTLREQVEKRRNAKGTRADRLDNLASQATAHHELIALDQGAKSAAYQSAIKRAIRIKRAADKERPELSPREAIALRQADTERFDQAMQTTPRRMIKLKPTTEAHREAREAVGRALESRLAAESANREPGLDPERKGVFFAIAQKKYREAQGPLKAARDEAKRTKLLDTPQPKRSSEEFTGKQGPTRGEAPKPATTAPKPPRSERAGLMTPTPMAGKPGKFASSAEAEATHPVGSHVLVSLAGSVPTRYKVAGHREIVDKYGNLEPYHTAILKHESGEIHKGIKTLSDAHWVAENLFGKVTSEGKPESKEKPAKAKPVAKASGAPAAAPSLKEQASSHRETKASAADRLGAIRERSVARVQSKHEHTPPAERRKLLFIAHDAGDKKTADSLESRFKAEDARLLATHEGKRVQAADTHPSSWRSTFADPGQQGHLPTFGSGTDAKPPVTPTASKPVTKGRTTKAAQSTAPRLYPDGPETFHETVDRLTNRQFRRGDYIAHNGMGMIGGEITGSGVIGKNPGIPAYKVRGPGGDKYLVPHDDAKPLGYQLPEHNRGDRPSAVKPPVAPVKTAAKAKAPASPVAPAPSPSHDLPTFAANVHSAASSVPQSGRFGDNKAFIHKVHEAYQGKHGAIPREQFNKQLLEANRAGHLELSRADLVEAMNPADVKASDTHHMGATYNFVRLPRQQAAPTASPSSNPDWKALAKQAEADYRAKQAEVLKAGRKEGSIPQGRGGVLNAAHSLGPQHYSNVLGASNLVRTKKDITGQVTDESIRKIRRKQREILLAKLMARRQAQR